MIEIGAPVVGLSNISVEFETQMVYAIMGKSGTGKSTVLSLLAGLDIPTDGDIFFEEKSLKELDRDYYRARNIGMIFQGGNLLTNATALAHNPDIIIADELWGMESGGIWSL